MTVAAENWTKSSGVGSWQLAEDGGVERVRLIFESPAAKENITWAVVQ
jgi:hypothetical protein